MIFLKVLLAVLLALWLLSFVRVGGRVRYGGDGLSVWMLAGPVKIQLLPAKPKKARPKKARQKKKTKKKEEPAPAKPPEPEPEENRPGTLSRLLKLLPMVGQACGALKRKIRIDDLDLNLIWGGSDPAAIALGYGQANAVLGILWPLFDHNFNVKRHSFQVSMDYSRTQPGVELSAALTLTVGQAAALGVRYGWKLLSTWMKSGKSAGGLAPGGKKPKKQEAMSHE